MACHICTTCGTQFADPAAPPGRGRCSRGAPRHVSFMHSYPNYIPLGAGAVRRIVVALEPYRYEQIFGAWWGRNILTGGREAVARSAARYIARIS